MNCPDQGSHVIYGRALDANPDRDVTICDIRQPRISEVFQKETTNDGLPGGRVSTRHPPFAFSD